MLKNNILEKMSNHAQKEYPKEACGIITLDFEYIPCKNISRTPKTHFILDPISILTHESNIWGFFHSHPGSENPLPSEQDIHSTVFSEYRFIVGFKDKFYLYWSDNGFLRYEQINEDYFNNQ